MNKKIFSIFLILLFLLTISSCKTSDIKLPKETTLFTETTKVTETTIVETTAITEIIDTSPIEDEGVIVPYIEGLKYDKETNTYYALKDNTYGLEVDTKAGVFVKDAFELFILFKITLKS